MARRVRRFNRVEEGSAYLQREIIAHRPPRMSPFPESPPGRAERREVMRRAWKRMGNP